MSALLNLILMAFLSFAGPKIEAFRDSDLDLMLKKNAVSADSVVIYAWSPHMNLSVQGLSELIDYGRRNNLTVVAILDPNSNFELASEIAAKNKWPAEYLRPNESRTLFKRGIRVHYPSYHFISRGEFARPPLPGYKLAKELDEFRKGSSK